MLKGNMNLNLMTIALIGKELLGFRMKRVFRQ